MRIIWVLLICLSQIWFSGLVLAAANFGSEFTFTNDAIARAGARASGIVNIDEAIDAQKKLLAEFTKACLPAGDCVVETIKNVYGADCYKVSFKKDNFWLQISTDPSVVEVQSKASTIAQFTSHKAELDLLFASAQKVGIEPSPYGAGGGHIHMDFASAFEGDKMLFRNFIVDFMNHQELGGPGAFGSENSNAPHLAALRHEQQDAFKQVIKDFDERRIMTARGLASAINTRVYTANLANWPPPEKYQALNLTRIPKPDGEATVEFRALNPQRDADEFLMEITLFEKRVDFLKTLKGPIKVLDFIPMDAMERVGAFRAFVEESGLDWAKYRKMMRNGGYYATDSVASFSRTVLETDSPDHWERALTASSRQALRTCSQVFSLLKPSAP